MYMFHQQQDMVFSSDNSHPPTPSQRLLDDNAGVKPDRLFLIPSSSYFVVNTNTLAYTLI
jgi:hypothetical protein